MTVAVSRSVRDPADMRGLPESADLTVSVSAHRYLGAAALAILDDLVHLQQIAGEPSAGPEGWRSDLARPGCVVTTAAVQARLVGFTTSWLANRDDADEPGGGRDDVDNAVPGRLLGHVTVVPAARPYAVLEHLLDLVLREPFGHATAAWLPTGHDALPAMRAIGWHPVTAAGGGRCVLLAPGHPALVGTYGPPGTPGRPSAAPALARRAGMGRP